MVIVIVRQPVECNSDSTKIDLWTIDWHSCQYQSTFPVRSDSPFHSFSPRISRVRLVVARNNSRAREGIILINRQGRARPSSRATVVRTPRKKGERGQIPRIRELSGFGRSVDSRACSISGNVENGIAPWKFHRGKSRNAVHQAGAENNFEPGWRKVGGNHPAPHTGSKPVTLRSTMWIRSIQDRNAPTGFWRILLLHLLLLPPPPPPALWGSTALRARDGTYVSRHDVVGLDRWIAVPRVAASVARCWHHGD